MISRKLAYFTFDELCGEAKGSVDYIAIAEAFDTVFIADVPKMTLNEINQVRRFITLIDELYDHSVKVVILADAPINELFVADKSAKYAPDEVFAFDRTVSRLIEMRSEQYLLSAWGETGPEFLARFKQEVTEEQAGEIWDFYDIGTHGFLYFNKIQAFVQDISEVRVGHRQVPDGTIEAVMQAMGTDRGGKVDKPTFVSYLTKHGLVLPGEQ